MLALARFLDSAGTSPVGLSGARFDAGFRSACQKLFQNMLFNKKTQNAKIPKVGCGGAAGCVTFDLSQADRPAAPDFCDVFTFQCFF